MKWLFLILFLLPSVSALTSTASVDIGNSPVEIELVTTDIEKGLLTVKTRISDENSFKDIKKVEVQISKDNKILRKFSPAELDSSSGTEALYIYQTNIESFGYGTYKAEVKAYDPETSEKRSVNFEYSEQKTLPTGAFIAYNKEKGLISRLFGLLRSFFD